LLLVDGCKLNDSAQGKMIGKQKNLFSAPIELNRIWIGNRQVS